MSQYQQETQQNLNNETPQEKEIQKKQSFTIFQSQLLASKSKLYDEAIDKIKKLIKQRQDQTYHLLSNDKNEYFSSIWSFLQKQLNLVSPRFEVQLLEQINNRHQIIFSDILEDKLVIQQKKIYQEPYQQIKNRKISLLRQQSTQIQKKLYNINDDLNQIKHQHQTNDSRWNEYEVSQQKIKEYQQFIRKQKKQKQQRYKLIQQQKRKQQQLKLKHQKQQMQRKQKIDRQKKQQFMKKLKQNEQKRKKEKIAREERDKDYKFISKSLAQHPPLFKKLQQNFNYRYSKYQMQNRSKVKSERKSMILPIDIKQIEEHQKKYQQAKQQRDRKRRQRMQQFQKIMQLQKQQMQIKYKSKIQINTHYIDPKQQQRKSALQKRQKAKKYIQQIVKQRYLPKIDQDKRKQFLKILENMNSNKKYKKVKLQDGSYQYQQLKQSDSRQVGLQYLQKTKQIAAQMKGRRKKSQNDISLNQEKPKIVDYLSQMRKKGTSMSNRNKLNFVNNKNMTFDQKLKKVEIQSQRLQQLAKQKQSKLKYGKFTTSQQILEHKQQIDQHYIDIINMKLKLINYKQQ